ncbi:MAG: hypothetical protein ACRDFR_05415, partial [Candidatus Limnocylindria bacterium]
LVDLEAAIHVRDLGVGSERVTVLNDPDELVAKVMPPRVLEEELAPEVEGEAGEEGEEGAEGAEGAEREAGAEPGTEGRPSPEDEG